MSTTPVLIRPLRSLNGLVADAVLEEKHRDELIITEHPVEQGAVISDHAYKRPAELSLSYVWSGGSPQNTTGDITFLTALYQKLLQLQVNRTLFQVFTGKRAYNNMLVESIITDTDKKSENILLVELNCKEVLIAPTQLVQISSAAQQQLPNKTAPILNQGQVNLSSAPNFNANPGGPR